MVISKKEMKGLLVLIFMISFQMSKSQILDETKLLKEKDSSTIEIWDFRNEREVKKREDEITKEKIIMFKEGNINVFGSNLPIQEIVEKGIIPSFNLDNQDNKLLSKYLELNLNEEEIVPRFQEDFYTEKEMLKKSFQTKLQNHIRDNFIYPENSLNMGIQGEVRIIIVIGPKGLITSIKTSNSPRDLVLESVRIISLLKPFLPAIKDGKPVKIPFSFPIKFRFLSENLDDY